MKTVTMETKTSVQYIASDPAICHGEPTFRGTRILVADVLEQVESGMAWEAIIEEWRYEIDRDAIAAAVRVSHLLPEDSDISETEWLQAAAANPAFDFLKDSEEDMYTLSDGGPFYESIDNATTTQRSGEKNGNHNNRSKTNAQTA